MGRKMSVRDKLRVLQARSDINGKEEYEEYRRCAVKLDNDINQKAETGTVTILEKLNKSMKKNDLASVEIGDRTFIMQKDKDGKTTYSVKIPGADEPQEMKKSLFREAIRVETKRDIAKNIDYEGAVIAINDNQAIYAKPADLGTDKENIFSDNDSRFNYFIKDTQTGETMQISDKQVQKVFKDSNIDKKDIEDLVATSLHEAKQKAKMLGNTAARASKKVASKATRLVTDTLRKGKDLGEDMARM